MKTTSKVLGRTSGKVAYSGLLIAIGVLLPQAFHMFGQEAGMVFLPIQLPVLIAGLLLGPYYGGMVGFLVTVLSSLLTGMPPIPKVYFMIFELTAYGAVIGLLKKRFSIFISLLGAMAAGRILYGITLMLGVQLFQIQAPFANGAAFWGGIITGIPGMAIQLLIVPLLYAALKKGGLIHD